MRIDYVGRLFFVSSAFASKLFQLNENLKPNAANLASMSNLIFTSLSFAEFRSAKSLSETQRKMSSRFLLIPLKG